jgi:hypothetical protein
MEEAKIRAVPAAERRLINVRLEGRLHRALRIKLATEGRSAQKLFEGAALAYVEGRLPFPLLPDAEAGG